MKKAKQLEIKFPKPKIKWKLTWLYYIAVRLFGKIFWNK